MPFGALKGFLPLNIAELFKENDIQLAHVLPAFAFTPSSGSLSGRLRRIYERSIFECAKLTKSVRGWGEILPWLTEVSLNFHSRGAAAGTPLHRSAAVGSGQLRTGSSMTLLLGWHAELSPSCIKERGKTAVPQCTQDPAIEPGHS